MFLLKELILMTEAKMKDDNVFPGNKNIQVDIEDDDGFVEVFITVHQTADEKEARSVTEENKEFLKWLDKKISEYGISLGDLSEDDFNVDDDALNVSFKLSGQSNKGD